MEYSFKKTVTVVTPTIGKDVLADAVRSVQEQTYPNIKHLLVIDGSEFVDAVCKVVPNSDWTEYGNCDVMVLPYNTGGSGFYGHRIYAAVPHLINTDYIAFLDEDNWFDPDHIESLVNTLENANKNDVWRTCVFSHSLRKIYLNNGTYLDDDNCESIGDFPIFHSQKHTPEFLVDTSSYLFSTSWLAHHSQLWHSGWGGDRKFFMSVKDSARHVSTGKHTLCYRLDAQPEKKYGSIDFFKIGNQIIKQQYNGNYPWEKTTSILGHTVLGVP